MQKFGIGQPVSRKEDPRLVTGHGRYTDDITLEHQVRMHVVRSPYPMPSSVQSIMPRRNRCQVCLPCLRRQMLSPTVWETCRAFTVSTT